MAEASLLTFERQGAFTIGRVQSASVLDALNVAQFGEEVLHYVKQHSAVWLVLDFCKVEYLSSAVLSELLRIDQAVKSSQGRLRLCAVNDAIRKVFEITNLDKVFHIDEDVPTAIRRFKRALQVEAQEESWSQLRKEP